MSEAVLIYPNQLFKKHPAIKNDSQVFIIEDPIFFTDYKFHFNKLVLHRASMKFYEEYLSNKGVKVTYIDLLGKTSDIKNYVKDFKKVITLDPVNFKLERVLKKEFKDGLEIIDTPLFINSIKDIEEYSDKKLLMENFYRKSRKKYDILIDKDGEPVGDKWNFDHENRKKLPKDIEIPKIYKPAQNDYVKEAKKYVKDNLKYYGSEDKFIFPTTFKEAEKSFSNFLKNRFDKFGDYEDAISENDNFIFHSILTPYLNIGLITPKDVLDKTLKFSSEKNIPINSLEGFVRQVIGWREFMRLVYIKKGKEMTSINYFNFDKKLSKKFYNANTEILPVDNAIKKVISSGYCHHIERLMILSNFMLLSRFNPKDVYKWFMEMFIDSYEWVMVPNVYGMGQFSDGGMFATKPYISGSNYVLKMSDYKKGEWSEVWDAMYWLFIEDNLEKIKDNGRMGLVLNILGKKDKKQIKDYRKIAKDFIN